MSFKVSKGIKSLYCVTRWSKSMPNLDHEESGVKRGMIKNSNLFTMGKRMELFPIKRRSVFSLLFFVGER